MLNMLYGDKEVTMDEVKPDHRFFTGEGRTQCECYLGDGTRRWEINSGWLSLQLDLMMAERNPVPERGQEGVAASRKPYFKRALPDDLEMKKV
ncbi:MAG: hypothetical protein V8S95_09295 [Odoribacter sp.]